MQRVNRTNRGYRKGDAFYPKRTGFGGFWLISEKAANLICLKNFGTETLDNNLSRAALTEPIAPTASFITLG
jgi:hypothetical protein